MISKYFPLASVLVVTLLLLSSCLNSSTDNVEYSPDAQIYTFSLSSKTDTASLLSATQFTIDQINGRIFNQEPLPYLFQVDSVLLSISGANSYSPFSQVLLTLDADSTIFWRQSDSVSVNRLSKITTYAPDGITKKEYSFELNIHQQDPYILNWQKLKSDYLPASPLSQKSVAFGGNLITYYLTAERIEAVASEAGEGTDWRSVTVAGLPVTSDLSTVTLTGEGFFILDTAANTVYHSLDGMTWNAVSASYSVQAIYGSIPASGGEKLLLAVDHGDEIRFAETADFTELEILNRIPDQFPTGGFSSAKVDDPSSYSIKYLLLAGGTDANHILTNQIWILQKKEGGIKFIPSSLPLSLNLQGSSLFFYDNKPYLMAISPGKNILYYSDNFGLDWEETKENQVFPAAFPKRTHASVLTDAANYIWIFGGISSEQTQITDVWRGRLNKFTGM